MELEGILPVTVSILPPFQTLFPVADTWTSGRPFRSRSGSAWRQGSYSREYEYSHCMHPLVWYNDYHEDNDRCSKIGRGFPDYGLACGQRRLQGSRGDGSGSHTSYA